MSALVRGILVVLRWQRLELTDFAKDTLILENRQEYLIVSTTTLYSDDFLRFKITLRQLA